jgi:DnaK suppressor protein
MPKRELDYDFFRRQLEAERERLAAGQRNIDLRLAGKGPFGEGTETAQDLDEHQGDTAAENVERQTDLAYHESVHQLLNQITVALQRIEAGTYGVCSRCGEGIDEARLKALPWAHLCVTCQGRMESG